MNVITIIKDVEFTYANDPQQHLYHIPSGLIFPYQKVFCISGVSGSGKSTLLTMLAGLRRFDRGCIKYHFGNKYIEVTPENWDRTVGPDLWKNIGFSFQKPELIRTLTVQANLDLVSGGDKDIPYKKLFSEDDWKGIANSKVWEISGGQIQRIGLLRTFMGAQDLILLDEPTNNLDIGNRKDVADFVNALSNQCSLLIVSHDDEFLNTINLDGTLQVKQTVNKEGREIRSLTLEN